MNRAVSALVIAIAFGLAACAVETDEPEVQLVAPEQQLEAQQQAFEGMALELHREVNASYKEAPPSTNNTSCGSWSGWTSNGSLWCGAATFTCILEGSVGKYTRESRNKICCAPSTCWREYEYRDTRVQCGC